MGSLESPGTKAYTVEEARELFSAFNQVKIRTVLTHGDLLSSGAGQRHQGALLSCSRSMAALVHQEIPSGMRLTYAYRGGEVI
jgi:hypothetical protein